METFHTEYSNHMLVKTVKVFHKKSLPEGDIGWQLTVFFDETSKVYRVIDFPVRGSHVAFSEMPPDGDYKLKTDFRIQYAKDYHRNYVLYSVRDRI